MSLINFSNRRVQASHPPLSAKLANLREQLRWITPLAGSRLRALKLLVAIRLQEAGIHRANFAGRLVNFRTQDLQALREVLADLEYGFLARSLGEDSTPLVLDIGGHIGTLPIWLLSICPGARILSIEADPETFEILSRNAAAAVESGARWTVLHGAAGASQGEILYLSNTGPSMGHRIDAKGSVPVSSLTLPHLLDHLAQGRDVDLLKVDIEGSEEKFLCAAPDALKRVKNLVIELHPSLCDTQRVEALLKQNFDDIRPVGGRMSSKPLLFCTRRKT